MKFRYKVLLGLLFVLCAVLSISIDLTYTVLIIFVLGWFAFIPYRLIGKHFEGIFDVSVGASLTQRALTLWLALSIFIAGSLIISVVLDFLLSIRVFIKFD